MALVISMLFVDQHQTAVYLEISFQSGYWAHGEHSAEERGDIH